MKQVEKQNIQDKKLILLSNDDGIHAPGINILADALSQIGDVYKVAPHIERSASSHSISFHTPLRVEKISSREFAVEGTPVDCVMLAMSKILPRAPDLVISGINRGANLGRDTIYSGTVGAAMEGAMKGIPSFALSSHGGFQDRLHYDSAAELLMELLEKWKDQLDTFNGKVVNINVPSMPRSSLRGTKMATLGKRIYPEDLTECVDPRGGRYYWLGGGGFDFEDIEGSDCSLIDQGFATVSVLQPDLTDPQLNSKIADMLD